MQLNRGGLFFPPHVPSYGTVLCMMFSSFRIYFDSIFISNYNEYYILSLT